MKVGTKSVLFGVHQFLWHPITVYMAWLKLYGVPSFDETICIIVHDWGYFGKSNMDGPSGESHPVRGANIAHSLVDRHSRCAYELCLYHSRHYARKHGKEPSKLCWADKLSIAYDPKWFYLLRSKASGELKEYRSMSNDNGLCPDTESDGVWFDLASKQYILLGKAMDPNAIPYQHEKHRP